MQKLESIKENLKSNILVDPENQKLRFDSFDPNKQKNQDEIFEDNFYVTTSFKNIKKPKKPKLKKKLSSSI